MNKTLLLLLALPWGLSAMDTYQERLNELGKAFTEERLTPQTVMDFYGNHKLAPNELEALEHMVYRLQRIVFETADASADNLNLDTIPAAENSLAGLLFIRAAAQILSHPHYQPKVSSPSRADDLKRIEKLSTEHVNRFTELARTKRDEARLEEAKKDPGITSNLFSTIFSVEGIAIASILYLTYRYTQHKRLEQTI